MRGAGRGGGAGRSSHLLDTSGCGLIIRSATEKASVGRPCHMRCGEAMSSNTKEAACLETWPSLTPKVAGKQQTAWL